ncbi:MAG: phosphoenolpyruvate--protein phosphotransferase [bacterium]|nr:phosphoenolpyruvate--protein phosphotransferase [Candidatus Colisoma equi]
MSSRKPMQTITGLATARGFAIGPVFVYRGDGDIPIPEYVVDPGHEPDELVRLKRAIVETKRDLELMISTLRERAGRADVKVFECHQMLLEDSILRGEAEKHILEGRLNAEAAVRRTAHHARAQFERMHAPYFRERVRDLDDVERRLLKSLTGFGGSPHLELKAPSVVIADDLTPSETVQLPREYVLGFATNGGSTTSHVALLARAMGIPAVTGLGDVTARVIAGETVLLDGTNGKVTIAPTAAAVMDFSDLIERQKEIVEEATLGDPAGTLRDGGDVLLYANIHPGVPVADVKGQGARGVGLYRSEYLWLNREIEPTEEEQFEAYRNAAQFAATLGPKATIAIRTLDIGGDKLVRGISTKEANPFLGNRSIRYLLSNPDVFRTQLRAILRASAFGKIGIMYPMISCVEELQESAAILADVKRNLDEGGIAYDRDVLVGAMIEVPSAAINADALAKHVDFFSIGTNDLVQYTMAADRGNEAVAHLYQPVNPAVLKLMRMTIAAAKKADIWVGVCGESASDPIVGVLWAAMGVDMLSMSATYIPLMAKLFERLTRADLDDYMRTVESMGDEATAAEILAKCNAWMRSRIPDLDNIVI